MASGLRQQNVSGYRISVCENSRGETFYLYQTSASVGGNDKNAWVWHKDRPGSQNRVLVPATMPNGFSLSEARENNQPVLEKD
jgi:hypothetical protein